MCSIVVVQMLISMKANIEDKGVKGDCTPLMEAANAGYVDIVQLLIDNGADVNAKSTAGETCAGVLNSLIILLFCKNRLAKLIVIGSFVLMSLSAEHVC